MVLPIQDTTFLSMFCRILPYLEQLKAPEVVDCLIKFTGCTASRNTCQPCSDGAVALQQLGWPDLLPDLGETEHR